MSDYFRSKHALVTGAGKGIGRAIALKLANIGASVHAISRTESDLQSLKKECSDIEVYNVDISDWNKTRLTVKSIGAIDLLVNNAAIARETHFLGVTEEELDGCFDVNFKAAFNISQVVAKGMVERGKGGVIVNMSSISSIRYIRNLTVYSTTKAALDMLTKTMATELGPYKIRVNSICPAAVLTNMTMEAYGPIEIQERIKDRTPLKRMVEIDDAVNATIFLLSNQSAMITGSVLPIDGGRLNKLY